MFHANNKTTKLIKISKKKLFNEFVSSGAFSEHFA